MPRSQGIQEQHIADITDLIRNACEFYLLSPSKNSRAVFILVDDICELVMKTALEEAAKSRQNVFRGLVYSNNFLLGDAHKIAYVQYINREITEEMFRSNIGAASSSRKNELDNYLQQSGDPRSWSSDISGGFKGFGEVAQEVKSIHPSNLRLHDLLDDISGRRTTRNRLFHDQRHIGLTVTEDRCLIALIDLFSLAEELWSSRFRSVVDGNAVVRAQRAVLRLKNKAQEHGYLINEYDKFVGKKKKPVLNASAQGYDFYVLQDDATVFYTSLRAHFENKIAQCRNKINEIQNLTRQSAEHVRKVASQQQEISHYEDILRDCFDVSL